MVVVSFKILFLHLTWREIVWLPGLRAEIRTQNLTEYEAALNAATRRSASCKQLRPLSHSVEQSRSWEGNK
jgi:hypothetical protein